MPDLYLPEWPCNSFSMQFLYIISEHSRHKVPDSKSGMDNKLQ